MKLSGAAIAAILVLSCVPVFAQQAASAPAPAAAPDPANKPRIFVTESDSWQVQGASGGGFGGFGGAMSGGASPQTAEVIKTIGQRCPDVIVNSKVDVSDYVIRLEHEGGKGLLRKKDKVAVFQQKTGDSIFSESTLSVGGSVQDACAAIAKDWAAYSVKVAALAATPAATATAATALPAGLEMASLTVDAGVAGADITIDGDFMGNTPSTLSVKPGKHTILVQKKGYADWTRTMNVSGSGVNLKAELEPK